MEIRTQVTVRVPADQAWRLIGDGFGEIGSWATPITSSALDSPPEPGSVRTCEVQGFGPIRPGVVQERLITFDPGARSFSYEAVSGLPPVVISGVSRWSVDAVGTGACVVRVHATLRFRPLMRPLGLLLRWRMGRESAAVLEELAHRLETGTAHPRKRAGAGGPSTVQ